LSIYLDTSFLGGLFIQADTFAGRAATFFAEASEPLVVSDFAAAEFASVVARVNRINEVAARAIFAGFDTCRARFADEEDAVSADIQAATAIIRRLELNLRAPDAINLAIALRLDASVATFDRRMAESARTLGIAIAAA